MRVLLALVAVLFVVSCSHKSGHVHSESEKAGEKAACCSHSEKGAHKHDHTDGKKHECNKEECKNKKD